MRKEGRLILRSPCPGGTVQPVVWLGTQVTHSPGSPSGPTPRWGVVSPCASPPPGSPTYHPHPLLGLLPLCPPPLRLSGALGPGGRRRGMRREADGGSRRVG